MAPPTWDPSDPTKSANALCAYAEGQAAKAVQWYYTKKGRKAVWSWVLRSTTILLTALGGLIPVFASAIGVDQNAQMRLNQWGYIAIGLAALSLAFDRFTGSSTGWMRYIGSAMVLETLLEEFRMDWSRLSAGVGADGAAPTIASFIDRIRQFTLAIRAQIEKETQAWMTEFQSSLAQLESETTKAVEATRLEARKQADAIDAARREAADRQRPGAIDLTVKVNGALTAGYTVELDGKVYRQAVTGPKCGIANVAPGLHEVAVTASVNAKPMHASKIATVIANAATGVTIELV
jgi:hypothetical protein